MEDIEKKEFYNTQIPTYNPEQIEIFYDDPAADNTRNELIQLSNVEFHVQAVEIEEVEINSNLSVNSRFEVTSIESQGTVHDNLDSGIDAINPCTHYNSTSILPVPKEDTKIYDNVDIERKKSPQCRDTHQLIILDDPPFIKEKERRLNSDLQNLNVRSLLSKWRERIKSNLLFCKVCNISFTKVDELRYHNNAVHNSMKLLTTVDRSVQELNNEIVIKSIPDREKKNKARKGKHKKRVVKANRFSSFERIIVKEGVLFRKSGFKASSISKTDKGDGFDTVKHKGVKRRTQSSLTKSPFITDDILKSKAHIQMNCTVPIADIMITLKEKDGKKRKVCALDSDGNLLKNIKKIC